MGFSSLPKPKNDFEISLSDQNHNNDLKVDRVMDVDAGEREKEIQNEKKQYRIIFCVLCFCRVEIDEF